MRIAHYYYYHSDCFPLWAGTLYTITATIVIVFGISPRSLAASIKYWHTYTAVYSEHGL